MDMDMFDRADNALLQISRFFTQRRRTLSALAVMLLAFVFLFLMVGCARPDLHMEEAGVILHGYGAPGYLENTNEFPVQIKCVWTIQGHGESTIFVRTLAPKERYRFETQIYHSYHIYRTNGAWEEIGFIRPYTN